MQNSIFIVLVLLVSCCTPSQTLSDSLSKGKATKNTKRVVVGPLQARGLWTKGKPSFSAILMLPGSGVQGPEEMMPASVTADGKDHAIFNQLAQPFIDAGFSVLQLGKPGVNFFADWNNLFYDRDLYRNLRWKDLVANGAAGVEFIRNQEVVGQDRIYILGHSEGTQVAVEIAQNMSLKGVILLGFSGEDLLTTVTWQVLQREIDLLIKTDVDSNGDGFVSIDEAKRWPEFSWPWQKGVDKVAISEIEQVVRTNPSKLQYIDAIRTSDWCSDGHCTRGPYYRDAAGIEEDVFVFTGELDVQTRPEEALRLKSECRKVGKKNCYVEIVSGLQHGFNPPKPPRGQPVLDIAVGPVSETFHQKLRDLSSRL